MTPRECPFPDCGKAALCKWCGRCEDCCRCLANMVVGTVDAVYESAWTVTLTMCCSSPGEGVGYDLDPNHKWVFEMKPKVPSPEVGQIIDVRTPHRIGLGHYVKCWWFPADN